MQTENRLEARNLPEARFKSGHCCALIRVLQREACVRPEGNAFSAPAGSV
jgi:hypothetical protein